MIANSSHVALDMTQVESYNVFVNATCIFILTHGTQLVKSKMWNKRRKVVNGSAAVQYKAHEGKTNFKLAKLNFKKMKFALAKARKMWYDDVART